MCFRIRCVHVRQSNINSLFCFFYVLANRLSSRLGRVFPKSIFVWFQIVYLMFFLKKILWNFDKEFYLWQYQFLTLFSSRNFVQTLKNTLSLEVWMFNKHCLCVFLGFSWNFISTKNFSIRNFWKMHKKSFQNDRKKHFF